MLRAGETLRANEYRRSPNGRYYLKMTADGTLVSRCGSGPSGDRPPPTDPTSAAGKGVLNLLSPRPPAGHSVAA